MTGQHYPLCAELRKLGLRHMQNSDGRFELIAAGSDGQRKKQTVDGETPGRLLAQQTVRI